MMSIRRFFNSNCYTKTRESRFLQEQHDLPTLMHFRHRVKKKEKKNVCKASASPSHTHFYIHRNGNGLTSLTESSMRSGRSLKKRCLGNREKETIIAWAFYRRLATHTQKKNYFLCTHLKRTC
ncbi:hypothetical protein CEXT_472981 [Caerostris extrusa]|uniref:Uncharacterized protein n=1 Tax=Caerostris extrusa TaxID=172846 RepID=A0AAV4X9E4_CAEEX|nr:hypothetical protein CEXT_472981 [Caerostris extrusa]